MLKKLTLLAMAVAALVAFAAPATASAEEGLTWETGVEPLGPTTEEGDAVHFTGTLTSTKGALKISCEATANTVLWNDPEKGAHGEVLSLSLTPDPVGTHGCTVAVNPGTGTYVDVTECHVEGKAEIPTPWTITTSATGTAHHVTIDNAAFINKFTGPGCLQHLGIPSGTEVTDKGNATGVAVAGGDCFRFTNAGTFEGGSLIDGELCATGDLRLTTEI